MRCPEVMVGGLVERQSLDLDLHGVADARCLDAQCEVLGAAGGAGRLALREVELADLARNSARVSCDDVLGRAVAPEAMPAKEEDSPGSWGASQTCFAELAFRLMLRGAETSLGVNW